MPSASAAGSGSPQPLHPWSISPARVDVRCPVRAGVGSIERWARCWRPQLAAVLGESGAFVAAIAVPWAVFFVGWIAAGLLTPSGTDNRPIRTHGPLDVEHELVEV